MWISIWVPTISEDSSRPSGLASYVASSSFHNVQIFQISWKTDIFSWNQGFCSASSRHWESRRTGWSCVSGCRWELVYRWPYTSLSWWPAVSVARPPPAGLKECGHSSATDVSTIDLSTAVHDFNLATLVITLTIAMHKWMSIYMIIILWYNIISTSVRVINIVIKCGKIMHAFRRFLAAEYYIPW